MLKKLEKTFKSLGDKNRLRIINMLKDKPMCVCEITHVLGLSQSTVSGHLRVLKEAGLVEDSKDGLWVEYSLLKEEKFTEDLLIFIQKAMEPDKEMKKVRELAGKASRLKLCKK